MKSKGKSARPARNRSAAKAPSSVDRALALALLKKFRLIINVAKRHYRWVEEQCGINGAQLWVLWEIDHAPGLRVSELAAAMAMHQSTVSNLIEKLARAKLLRRARDDADQRVVALHLTAAGRALLKRAPQPARGRLHEALFNLPQHSLAALDTLLGGVLHEMNPDDRAPMHRPLAELLAGKP